MTDREKAIVMAYTGATMLVGDKFSVFHKYIEDICGRPIYTQEIASLAEEIKEKSRADFIELCREETRAYDCISKKEAVNALRQSLYNYEDKTEKQFLDNNDLDVSEWFVHRIFVQNMNDADVKAINDLPSIQQEPKAVLYSGDGYADGYMVYDTAECPNCGYEYEEDDKDWKEPFCPHCGQTLKWESEG